jgi:hypothetical protein
MSDQEYPNFPATLEFLVLSLKTQTELHLGLLHTGDPKDQPEPEFRIARHSIDLLSMLQEKTRGNCTNEEQRLIENSLTELRFRFVQAKEAHQKRTAAASAEPGKTEDAGAKKEGQTGS